jgi:5-methylcytosine-specific restriction endonuclease McrA
MSIPQTRTCARCKETKPLDKEHFGIMRRNKCGFAYYCRDCIREKARIEREQHPDRVRARVKKWQQENPEKLAESKRNWNEANPDKVRQYWQEYAERNPEVKRESRLRSQRNNPEAHNERNRRYAQNHPEKIRAKCLNRWAMFKEADGHFTADDIAKIYDEQQERCAYCGITLHGDYEIDHVHPLSRGGSNWPDNLVLACPSCNSSKNNKTIEEWEAVRGW